MSKEYISRLPCEIVEAYPYAIITDYHPITGKEWGLRQKQLRKYSDDEEEDLDRHGREHSNEMQARNA